jgi:hypothetical protein
MDAPKTRTEKKGRDKQKGTAPYSAKHVRLQEALANTKTKANAMEMATNFEFRCKYAPLGKRQALQHDRTVENIL